MRMQDKSEGCPFDFTSFHNVCQMVKNRLKTIGETALKNGNARVAFS